MSYPMRLPVVTEPARPRPDLPLVVSYGGGVDSTAVLVGLWRRGIRPDVILMADTGSEHPGTYDYLPVLDAWFLQVGFPRLTLVRNRSPRTGYASLEENCSKNETLPSQAFRGGQPGGGACSARWKHEPMDRYLLRQAKITERVRVVGYDAGPQDRKRAGRGASSAETHKKDHFWYPLHDWNWDRQRCKDEILAAGLPLPRKSSCFYCPAMKPDEIRELGRDYPQLLRRAVDLEERARAGKHGLRSIAGLGRKFSWADFARENGLELPAVAEPGSFRSLELASPEAQAFVAARSVPA